MPRLIRPGVFAGAQLDPSAQGKRLIVWEKTSAGGRAQVVYEGEEAEEALIEIRDLLAGQADGGEGGEASHRTPPRKSSRKGA